MMERIELLRDHDRDLRFNGHWVASASSRKTNDQPRWLELNAYVTAEGKYVAEGIGRTVVDGEVDRHWAYVYDTAEDFVDAQFRDAMRCANCGRDLYGKYCAVCKKNTVREPTGERYLTRVSRELLEQMADVDDAVDKSLVVDVE